LAVTNQPYVYLAFREYYPWDGEDCSYLFPYAAASSLSYPLYLAVGTVMALIYYHVIDELG